MKRTILSALLILVLLMSMIGALSVSAQEGGGTVTGDKTLSETDILCDGSLQVTLTLDSQTGIAGNPGDIMLVLDRSGSMGSLGGQPLADLKTAAGAFVDLIDNATDGQLDGEISNGSRMGIVSFSTNAIVDVPLTTDATQVKQAIDDLVADGYTNHEEAIQMTQTELAASEPTNTKQMIIFTDGNTMDDPRTPEDEGGDPTDDATAAKDAGTEIFAIGLGNNVDEDALNEWASDPDSDYVFVTPESGDLQDIFEAIGAAIIIPAATDITVIDTIANHFSLSGAAASKGNIAVAGNVITWTIAELGTEIETLTYIASHDCEQPGGLEQVNVSVTYSDYEEHTVTFPNPTVNVRGCAAFLNLTPNIATNGLGTLGQTHTVTATITDDFDDPVADLDVQFIISSGPNVGQADSSTTNTTGQASFTYTATQGLAGLGTDEIVATVLAQCRVANELSDTAWKEWVDNTPPDVACEETVNPHGKTVPPAGSTTLPGPKGGQNEDGFYKLTAIDAFDPNPRIFVLDTGSGVVFGPFPSGTVVKYTEAAGATPKIKKMGSTQGQAGAVNWHIIGNGDMNVYAEDAAGNRADCTSCLVPPLPK
jgi:uncharacterized protein YegL